MRLRSLAKGVLTLIPGIRSLVPTLGTGGTDNATYSYNVWMKHLAMLSSNGMQSVPTSLGELGPGDSLGIGLCGMLSGVNNYFALDVVHHADTTRNLAILDELAGLFARRASGPMSGWPSIKEYLDEDGFPSHILSERVLTDSLAEARLNRIRRALVDPNGSCDEISIQYVVPWHEARVIPMGTVQLVLSHSVLEHVDDIDAAYRAMHEMLRPGGRMSHQIDFTAHGLSSEWNGFRSDSELIWRLARGNRPFLINRLPYSSHRDAIESAGFSISRELQAFRDDGISRKKLSKYWKNISDDDLHCSGAYVQAVKPSAD